MGKRFRIPIEGLPWVEVIGVVGHVKHDGLDDDRRAQVYWNHLQRAGSTGACDQAETGQRT